MLIGLISEETGDFPTEMEARGSGVKGAPWPCSFLRPGKDT